jgi:hypothetical protein
MLSFIVRTGQDSLDCKRLLVNSMVNLGQVNLWQSKGLSADLPCCTVYILSVQITSFLALLQIKEGKIRRRQTYFYQLNSINAMSDMKEMAYSSERNNLWDQIP